MKSVSEKYISDPLPTPGGGGVLIGFLGVGVPPGSPYPGPIFDKNILVSKFYLVGEPMTLTKYPVVFEPEHSVR